MVLAIVASSDGGVAVPVTVPPRSTETQDDRDLAQRVADLEALIEEARRRARRRRRTIAAFFVALAAGTAALIGFHGGGAGGTGAVARAGGSNARSQATKPTPSLAALPAGNRPFAFAFDPRRPSVVYVASPDARGGSYIFKTTDDGRHWQSTGARGTGWMSDILSLTADPQQPGTLYAGTDTAVYKTVDGGQTWRPFRQGLFPPHGGKRVCYPGGGTGYCVKLPFGTPGTTSWNRNNGWVLDVAVDPAHRTVVYAAAGAVRKSTDGGHTWRTVFVPTRWTESGFSRIAIAPTGPESVYAIAHETHYGQTAIYKSTDGGTTWRPTGGGTPLPPSCCADSEDALVVDAGDPQTLYAAVGQTVFATSDGGGTWVQMANGLPGGVMSLAADPRHAGTVYAGVEISHEYKTKAGDVEKPTGAIYKTTDGARTWREVFSGFGVERVAVDPARPSTVYAAGWSGRDPTHPDRFRLLRSTDGGLNWSVAG
jgi:photosystem II stability/assembly factor-like uncharacterized protein